jgi:hypothetical protein
VAVRDRSSGGGRVLDANAEVSSAGRETIAAAVAAAPGSAPPAGRDRPLEGAGKQPGACTCSSCRRTRISISFARPSRPKRTSSSSRRRMAQYKNDRIASSNDRERIRHPYAPQTTPRPQSRPRATRDLLGPTGFSSAARTSHRESWADSQEIVRDHPPIRAVAARRVMRSPE